MIATHRFDYVPYSTIYLHPSIANHRAVNRQKVLHYKDDILHNGLLEPLVVWERNRGELFLVGGFHRFHAIELIRGERPGYFDRVDVRVVTGELEEMRALNLKLNADRLDARLTECFDTVVFLRDAGWDKQRIAAFLDRSVSWVEEILRFVPGMDGRVRAALDGDKISWTKAKAICRAALAAEPGDEGTVVEAALAKLESKSPPPRRVLSGKAATKPPAAPRSMRGVSRMSRTRRFSRMSRVRRVCRMRRMRRVSRMGRMSRMSRRSRHRRSCDPGRSGDGWCPNQSSFRARLEI